MFAAIYASAPLLLTAQQTSGATATAPPASVPAAQSGSDTKGEGSRDTGTISGTVMTRNGSVVEGARVALSSLNGKIQRVVRSRSNGEFTLDGLPPGRFQVTVSGKGWGTYTSDDIRLKRGGFKFLSDVVLPLATTTSVSVSASPITLSEEQVQVAVHQRLLGVLPNFYSSYNWNAPPMLAQQKFQLALRTAIDPATIAGVAFIAGIEQYNDNFPSWGLGAKGYAKRMAAAYAGNITSKMVSDALLPSIFHQDPRFFYKGTGSMRSRLRYALSAAFIARGDDGHWEPSYSRMIGSFAASGISNFYYPPSDRGVGLTFVNGGVNLAADVAHNLLREFVLKRFTTRTPMGSPDSQ